MKSEIRVKKFNLHPYQFSGVGEENCRDRGKFFLSFFANQMQRQQKKKKPKKKGQTNKEKKKKNSKTSLY